MEKLFEYKQRPLTDEYLEGYDKIKWNNALSSVEINCGEKYESLVESVIKKNKEFYAGILNYLEEEDEPECGSDSSD